MIPRQKELFKNIVLEHIKTAQPVGSKLIVAKYHMGISSATVRNDMAELEDLGLITQPYTSAGRIPTEYGYKYFVENYVDLKKELNQKEKNEIIKLINNNREAWQRRAIAEKIKLFARILSSKSGLMVFAGFGKNDFYYTGLSNLFSQPEFQNLDLICNLSQIIDRLDEVIFEIYDIINKNDGVAVGIGKDNPFGDACSSIMRKVKDVLIGILGPMRMDYERNASLVNFAKAVI